MPGMCRVWKAEAGRILCLGAVLILFVGCRGPQRQATLDAAAYPPDFTLVFFVEVSPAAIDPSEPRTRPGLHLVEPDRTLRVALGPGVTPDLHPPATATLRPADLQTLHRLARDAGLTHASPPRRPADARPAVRYRVTVVAHGRSTTTLTTPERNPAAAQLLDELIRLRGSR
jgi:hypothetical protein